MLPRLKKRQQFLETARQGQKLVSPGVILQLRKYEDLEAWSAETSLVRVGFTASRKIGKAVARNRARRRLKAVAEEVLAPFSAPLASVNAAPYIDIVFIARSQTLERPFPLLRQDVRHALAQAGLRRSH